MATRSGLRVVAKQHDRRRMLNMLQKVDFEVRRPAVADIGALVDLEQRCWAQNLRATRRVISSRVARNPDGQFVLVVNGTIRGVLYTQKLKEASMVNECDVLSVERYHARLGKCLQFLSTCVHPELGHSGLGKWLIELSICCARASDDIERIIAVSRCSAFAGPNVEALDQHVKATNPQGLPVDPTLAYHFTNGATIQSLVRDYRPNDSANFGAGVLIEYQNRSRPLQMADELDAAQRPAPLTPGEMKEALGAAVSSIMDVSRDELQGQWSMGWMELGMDSARLIQLRAWLERALQLQLDASFFFEFATPDRTVNALCARQKGFTVPPSPSTARVGLDDRGVKSGLLPPWDTIAIIGMSCRLPGVEGLDAFWDLLSSGDSLLGPLPQERKSLTPHLDGNGGWFGDISGFDAAFFNFSESAARLLDPQQRMLLEASWIALEHANINPRSVAGTNTGIFFGMFSEDYRELVVSSPDSKELCRSPYYGTGTSNACSVGVLAHFLDTRGPASVVNTACSSSLVAICNAIRSLRAGECDMAIVGGANALLSESSQRHYSSVGMVSPSGTCQPLDENANGILIGEGAGVVICKRLSDCLRDGDTVLALIPAATLNQDGRSSVLTAPNPEAQRKLFVQTLQQAGVEARDVEYVELHGTGTSLGDPIELNQVASVLRPADQDSPLKVGSVKGNIGHTFAAAGVLSLIKVVMCLSHRQLVPQPFFSKLSSKVASPDCFEILSECQPWVREPLGKHDENVKRRSAMVSSFGFSGTNAQVFVSDPVQQPESQALEQRPESHAVHLLTISAASKASLEQLWRMYRQKFARELSPTELAEICYTSNIARAHLQWRTAFAGSSSADLARALELWTPPHSSHTDVPPITFVVDAVAMGGVADVHSALSQDSRLRHIFARTVSEMERAMTEKLDCTRVSTLFSFAFCWACASWWLEIGITPTNVTGQGVGAVVAAVLARRWSFEAVVTLLERPLPPPGGGSSATELLCMEQPVDPAPAPNLLDRKTGRPVQTLASVSRLLFEEATVEVEEDLPSTVADCSLVVRCAGAVSSVAPATGIRSRPLAWSGCLGSTLAQLYTSGHSIHWEVLHHLCRHRKCSIPTYTFDRRSFWIGQPESRKRLIGDSEHQANTTVWTCQWNEQVVRYLSDHRVRDVPLVPGTCYMEMVAPAVEEVFGDVAYELRDVVFENILYLDHGRTPTVRLTMDVGDRIDKNGDTCGMGVSIQSQQQGHQEWVTHVAMRISMLEHWEDFSSIDSLKERCSSVVECGEHFYESLGNAYAGDFRSLQRAWCGLGEAIGEINLERSGDDLPAFLRACAWLDASIYVVMVQLDVAARLSGLYVERIASVRVKGTSRGDVRKVWSHVEVGDGKGVWNVRVYAQDGGVLAHIEGLKLAPVTTTRQKEIHVDEWEEWEDTPELDGTVEMVVPGSVEDRKSGHQRRGSGRSLCAKL